MSHDYPGDSPASQVVRITLKEILMATAIALYNTPDETSALDERRVVQLDRTGGRNEESVYSCDNVSIRCIRSK